MSPTTHTTTTRSGVEPLQVTEGQIARQGDLILVPAPESAGEGIAYSPVGPDGAVVVEGRAAHVLRGDALVGRANEMILVRVGPSGAILSHERDGAQAEHAPLALAPGCDWVVLVQRTLDPRGDIRRAAD